MNFKTGAMFGLDARIALAIFGALSVISAAALYSAIQSAKTEKYNQYFRELKKASEQYYLDNYKYIEINHAGYLRLFIEDLAVNRESLSTWKGPYWSANHAAGNIIKDSMTESLHSDAAVYLFLRKSSTWTEMNDFTNEICISGNPDCYQWLTLYSGNASKADELKSIFNILDSIIDSGDGELDGTVRFNSNGAGYLMFKGFKHKY